jgi:hypothetical protein
MPMKSELDVGATLREVFETYREEAGVLLPVAFWLFLLVSIVIGLTNGNLALFPLQMVVSTIAGTLYQGMVVGLVSDVRGGRRDQSAGDLIRSVVPVFWPLIGAGILSGLGVGAGTLLLIVPGLYLMTIWAVISPAIVIERRPVFDAFGRSRHLVEGNGWRVFAVVAISGAIAVIAGLLFTAIATSITDGPIIRIVFTALASTLAAPISGLAAGVLYFRLPAIRAERPPADDLSGGMPPRV